MKIKAIRIPVLNIPILLFHRQLFVSHEQLKSVSDPGEIAHEFLPVELVPGQQGPATIYFFAFPIHLFPKHIPTDGKKKADHTCET